MPAANAFFLCFAVAFFTLTSFVCFIKLKKIAAAPASVLTAV